MAQPLVDQAAELVIITQFASPSMLQRKMRIAPELAAAVMAALEERGVVGPLRGVRPREVLLPAPSAPNFENLREHDLSQYFERSAAGQKDRPKREPDTLTSRQAREIDMAIKHIGRAMKALNRADLQYPDSARAPGRLEIERAHRALLESSNLLIDGMTLIAEGTI